MLEGEFKLFAQLMKVDEAQRLVYGRATEEVPDGSREIIDITKSWPRFEKWSQAAEKRSGGKSKGNIREMHEPKAAGKVLEIQKVTTDDGHLAIDIGTYCSDDSTWQKILDGTLTGFSIGGKYVERRPDPRDPSLVRYVADPREISYVDAPAVPTATYTLIKADGSEELRKFALPVIASGDHSPFEVEPFTVESDKETEATAPETDAAALAENLATSGNRIVEIPTVAGSFLSPAVAEVTGASPAAPKAEGAGQVEKTDEILAEWTRTVTMFSDTVAKLTELAKADEEKTKRVMAELKQRGVSVGIARREGAPLSAPNGSPEDWHLYADPANWAFPAGDGALAKAVLTAYNAGKGRENYTTREWHVLGRRIARLASDVLGTDLKYSPTMTKVEKKENEMTASDDIKKADLMGLLSQVNAALTSAVDMMGKDPTAARSLLMGVLGNLDEAGSSSPASMSAASPHPPMDSQQDAAVSALKAAASSPVSAAPSAASTPSASSPSDKAVSDASASPMTPSTPSSPVEKEASPIAPSSSSSSTPSSVPSVPGETGDSYSTALKAQLDAQSEQIKTLSAMIEKLMTQQGTPVAKAEAPALDLNAIVDGISEQEDPIVAAVLAGDVAKAAELAETKGGLTKVMNEAVQKSLASKPFFGAQRIYSPATPTGE
ncbi:MAG TPA: XkdF-like putative serine protease domain-containing protein [Verrucomicrobiae bacterium]